MTVEFNVLLGEATDCEARLYVEPHGVAIGSGLSLTATLDGPECRFARTLPSTIAFRQLPGDQRLLAEATVPDPCFWSPELPFLYTLRAKLSHDGVVVAAVERSVGLRRFGRQGRHLMLSGRRTVLRGGVVRGDCESADLTACREACVALLVDWPSEAFCRDAAETGVLLVARLFPGAVADVREIGLTVERLATCPAVVGVVLGPDQYDQESIPARGGQQLIGVGLAADDADAAVPAWAEVILVSGHDIEELRTAVASVSARVALPVMANYEFPPAGDAAAMRRAAERLQQQLTPCRDVAGYFAGK